MSHVDVDMSLATGREQYLRLLDEATDQLRNLDTLSPEQMAEVVRRREDLVEALKRFDMRSYSAPANMDQKVAEFRAFQENVTRKILEIDGLIIALAREKQAVIREKLTSLAKSATAFQAYERSGIAQRRPWVNNSA